MAVIQLPEGPRVRTQTQRAFVLLTHRGVIVNRSDSVETLRAQARRRRNRYTPDGPFYIAQVREGRIIERA